MKNQMVSVEIKNWDKQERIIGENGKKRGWKRKKNGRKRNIVECWKAE